MADEVNVPFIGNQRKEYLLVGGAAVAGYVLYRYWKARSAGTSTASTTAAATPAVGTLLGYDAGGNPVYQGASGPVDANGNPDTVVSTTTAGTGAYSNPAGDSGSTSSSGSSAGSAPQTDEQWTAAVESDLSNIGYDPQTVATALALYLSSQALTSAQVTIIRTAWAYEGRPPQHPSLNIVQGGTGTSPTPTNVNNPPAGLRVDKTSPTTVSLYWTPTPGATGYQVQYMAASGDPAGWHTTTAPAGQAGITIGELTPGGKVNIKVLAQPAASNATPATISVTLPRK